MNSRLLFSPSVIFGTLLLFQIAYVGCSARKFGKTFDSMHTMGENQHSPSPTPSDMDPQLSIFFTPNDIKIGKRIPVFFDNEYNPSTYPHLLSREESDSIPFSSANLPYLLDFFSFSADSPQAKAMEKTLWHCEFQPMVGETKFCATSLEFMLDFTHQTLLGPNNNSYNNNNIKLSVLATKFVTKPPAVSLQNYTIADVAEIVAEKMVGCHTLPYPYAVFYCHISKDGKNKLMRISLVGENGEDKVEAVAICHVDTTKWNKNHVSFRVLGIEPGSSPVCHFFPVDNLVWVPLPSQT